MNDHQIEDRRRSVRHALSEARIALDRDGAVAVVLTMAGGATIKGDWCDNDRDMVHVMSHADGEVTVQRVDLLDVLAVGSTWPDGRSPLVAPGALATAIEVETVTAILGIVGRTAAETALPDRASEIEVLFERRSDVVADKPSRATDAVVAAAARTLAPLMPTLVDGEDVSTMPILMDEEPRSAPTTDPATRDLVAAATIRKAVEDATRHLPRYVARGLLSAEVRHALKQALRPRRD